MSLSVAVVVPPMTQLNRPYPALAHIAAWLRSEGHRVSAIDGSLEQALALFSRRGLEHLFAAVERSGWPAHLDDVVANSRRYITLIDDLVRFLQGGDPGMAGRIVRSAWLPQGPRFAALDEAREAAAFGDHGQSDHARWLATLVIQDLADLARATVSPLFGLTSYGSSLAESRTDYGPLNEWLATKPDPVEALWIEKLPELIPDDLDLLCCTCPFPGNLPGALRLGQWCRRHHPEATVVLGGGYPSTELRELTDPRIFDVVDRIVLDAGEAPLSALCAERMGEAVTVPRCWRREDGAVAFSGGDERPRHKSLPAPDHSGLRMDRYLDLLETWNPMHRLWNEGRWLGVVAAYGCYWARCTFCDTSLPYIADYDPARASGLADQLDRIAADTGTSGFHLADEAAPPPLMVGLALELLRRGRSYRWWGNIRFDEAFTPDRCRLLEAAGLVAVSGGMEVACDAVLSRIDKGVDLQQLARVSHGFASAGVLVHGYLMYGFPGQNLQDTVDALEAVRQLIDNGCINAGFWHRFTVTAHSPVGKDPDAFGVRITGPERGGFAWNNLEHVEPGGIDHDSLGPHLSTALSSWLGGDGLDERADTWLPDAPAPSIGPDHIEQAIGGEAAPPEADQRVVWLGGPAEAREDGLWFMDDTHQSCSVSMPLAIAHRAAACLRHSHPDNWDGGGPPRWRAVDLPDPLLPLLREAGLVFV